MPDPTGDYLADLTTAPIFDDAIFLSEALRLSDGQDEDDLDAQLAIAARESGIENPYRFLCPDAIDISTAMSTITVSTGHRSSVSVHSRETWSTGVTSHQSRTSRDTPYVESSPAVRIPQPPRVSLSSEDYYESMMRRFRPNVRHRPSSSTVSCSTSAPSTPSSLPVPTPRKQKRASGLSLFSMFRRDSSSCSSRAHHGHHSKPLSPKLECGHSLSKYAIRVHIQEALDSTEFSAPHCCGKPLPKAVLETVLSSEEAEIVASDSLQSPIASSLRDSGYSEDGMSSIDLPGSLDSQTRPVACIVTAPAPSSQDFPYEEEADLDHSLANESFKILKTQQKEQFTRVSLFETNQRKALSAYQQWTLKRLTSQLDTNKEERLKQHAIDLERLDEYQIVAEHDLRKAQAQETQNVATALKHMEAYCAGANPGIAHVVTEDDRKKLARQHLIQQKLPAKHESAINVLRARQEKDTKNKLQKQHTELQSLDADYEREKRAEELRYLKDITRLEALAEARRKREMHRWDLKFEIWRRDWESQHSTTLTGRLPHEAWPETPESVPLDSSSSLALYLQAMG